ncbi:hypothetical protein [Streptomyces sp. NPDC001568]|uniref:hypothetical protein n=1 Tax=Streptomyces sp. NPDC001568 TaxID=3364588 RepID=UPI003697942B
MMNFLKDHQTILLAVFTVLVGFGGAWLGAKVQAGGGLAQAKAAKEAAETAAAATLQAVRDQTDRAAAAAHAATLRSLRTTAIADLLRTVREYERALNNHYKEPNRAAVDSAHLEFVHARSDVELSAPSTLMEAFNHLVTSTLRLRTISDLHAVAEQIRWRMAGMRTAETTEALRALENFRTAFHLDAGDEDVLKRDADRALDQVPGLSHEERQELIVDCLIPPLHAVLRPANASHTDSMTRFVTETRVVLGVNE